MSNALINLHIQCGEPCGEDADYFGQLMLDEVDEDARYTVVCDYSDGDKIITGSFWSKSTLEETKKHAKSSIFEGKNPRIAQLRFIE